MKMSEFFARHAVFTVDDMNGFLSARGSFNSNTRKALLTYHSNRGRIVPIRRGLYATVPLDSEPSSFTVDPYLVAARMSEDAILAYHTALEFHGKAYSVNWRVQFLSARKSLPLKFQSYEYTRVPVPRSLLAKGAADFAVINHRRSGVVIRVTSLERTFVDVLDRPDLTGSWEEIWRSLESVEFFDLDVVIEYVRLLANATTAAKVGLFVDLHKQQLMADDDHLRRLRALIPRQPHYIDRKRRSGCRLVKAWNLLVPGEILNGSWGEVL